MNEPLRPDEILRILLLRGVWPALGFDEYADLWRAWLKRMENRT